MINIKDDFLLIFGFISGFLVLAQAFIFLIGTALGVDHKPPCGTPLLRIEYVAPTMRIGCGFGYAIKWAFRRPGE